MARAATRTPFHPFHHSQLIRILADLSVMETTEPTSEFAETFGQWVGFADAIVLHGIHNAVAPEPSGNKSTASRPTVHPPNGEFTTAQGKLEASMLTSFAANADLFADDATPYALLRKLYAAQQRDMELSVRKLRVAVRAHLAQASPALKQLAALDAAFDGILLERERKLLSTIPLFLQRRFQHLQTRPFQLAGWLARFGQEFQTVLLAELDLRLQPTLALIEALNDQRPHST